MRWMADRGAKNFILPSRSGPKDEVAQDLIDEMNQRCVNIATPICDISVKEAVVTMLEVTKKTMPPIKGCIQASMILRVSHHPSLLTHHPTTINLLNPSRTASSKMSHADFTLPLAPKVQGSLEPSHPPPPDPRLLHPPLIHHRHNRQPWPTQLRLRKHLPRRPRPPPCLPRSEMHFP